ncbi:hypothetical protein HYV84_06560 [Candidatus Woesearchaeota archaeon]|nr:hypothetical protein [Candidatus Woesearchaeota archaeon]
MTLFFALGLWFVDYSSRWGGFIIDFDYYFSGLALERYGRVFLNVGFFIGTIAYILFLRRGQEPLNLKGLLAAGIGSVLIGFVASGTGDLWLRIALLVAVFLLGALSFKEHFENFLTPFLIFFISLFINALIMFGGASHWAGTLHLLMAALFFFFVIRNYSATENNALLNLFVFLFVDFLVYGIFRSLGQTNPLWAFFSNRLIFPIYVYASLYYIINYNAPFADMGLFLLFGLLVFNAFMLYNSALFPILSEDLTEILGPEERLTALEAAGTAMDNFRAWVGQLGKSFRESFESQLEYATGGYYRGKVEENQDPRNKVGVYLENVQSADKVFYQNEPLVVWGDLQARTLNFDDSDENKIKVTMSCTGQDMLDGEFNGKILPEIKGFEVSSHEQKPFECRFGSGEVKPGTSTVKVKATFNFQTFGTLKTYFMDSERIRALRRENTDPLAFYKITDKNPTALFTQGPVRLGIGTAEPPTGISVPPQPPTGNEDTPSTYTYLGITVKGDWNGILKEIKGLRIQVPKDFQLYTPGEIQEKGVRYCKGDFIEISSDEVDKIKPSKPKLAERLEQSFKEGYRVYELAPDALKSIKYPIDGYQSWRCSITIPVEKGASVLGKTPVSTHFFRAEVDYDYEVEYPIQVNVKGVPAEKTPLNDCNTPCPDKDGCVCQRDDCMVLKGTGISERKTCNTYMACSNRRRNYDEGKNAVKIITNNLNGWNNFVELCVKKQFSQDKLSALTEEERAKLPSDTVLNQCNKGSNPERSGVIAIAENAILESAKCGCELLYVIEQKKEYASKKDGTGQQLAGEEAETLRRNALQEIELAIANPLKFYKDEIVTEGFTGRMRVLEHYKNQVNSMAFFPAAQTGQPSEVPSGINPCTPTT